MWPFPSAAPEVPQNIDSIRNRDIILGDDEYRRRTRWTRLLIFYLRGLALFSLFRGLIDWSRILGFIGLENAFENSPVSEQVTVSLYAVMNCVAAVGLWLTSAWGAVLWLIVTLCEILMPWISNFQIGSWNLIHIVMAIMIPTYVVLTLLSARERSREH